MRSGFSVFIFLSVVLHAVALSSIMVSTPEDAPQKFKELHIKLGVKKTEEVPQVPAVSKAALAQKAQKALEPKKIVKDVMADENSVNLPENSEGKIKAAKKYEEKKEDLVRVVEPVSDKLAVEKKEVVASPPPTPVKKIASLKKDGHQMGNISDNNKKESLTYEKMLPLWFEQFKKYPEDARIMGLEGEGVVRITISRDGKVLKRAIEESAGHPLLDRALLKMIDDANPVIPVPPEYMTKRKMLSYRMKFYLGE